MISNGIRIVVYQPSSRYFSMYLQVKKIDLVPDKFGKHIKITMVGLYSDEGKWIKWVKLNEELAKVLEETQIPFNG